MITVPTGDYPSLRGDYRPTEVIIRPYEVIIRPYEVITRPYEVIIRSYGVIIRSYEVVPIVGVGLVPTLQPHNAHRSGQPQGLPLRPSFTINHSHSQFTINPALP